VQPLGPLATPVVRTFGMLLLGTAFLLIFVVFVRMMLFLGSHRGEELATVTAFALTLIPISLAYNAAHNYSYLTIQSQNILPLLADPLGRGWHLLPVSPTFQASHVIAGVAIVWYMQIILIVLGHIIAVYLAHLRASERFRSARHALLSQYPMLILMVMYTMTSLWILAQPITREV
jgi:hypothetical protein